MAEDVRTKKLLHYAACILAACAVAAGALISLTAEPASRHASGDDGGRWGHRIPRRRSR